MSDLRQAALQALEALRSEYPAVRLYAVQALEKALTEPEQEPVAWRLYKDGELYALRFEAEDRGPHYTWEPLYTAPTPRRPLTNEEISAIFDDTLEGGSFFDVALAVARAIERAHGIGGGE